MATSLFTAIILALTVAVGAWKIVYFVAHYFEAKPKQTTQSTDGPLTPDDRSVPLSTRKF
jgi:hypothetical protein